MILEKKHREMIAAVDAKYRAAAGEGKTSNPKKLHGALTAELVREALTEYFIQNSLPFKVSKQNVYIIGLPTEFDILIVKIEAEPYLSVLYNPEDVVAIIEVKMTGLLVDPKKEATGILTAADRVYDLYPHIAFGYLTMRENSPTNSVSVFGQPTVDHWRITQEILGQMRQRNAQLAIVYHNAGKDDVCDDSEWETFIRHLCNIN